VSSSPPPSEPRPALPITTSVLFANVANFFALGCGLGMARKAPGTVGTLLGVPLLWLMPQPLWLYLLVVVLLFIFGVWCCEKCSQHLGVHDHGGIVWDEVVGYLITMIALPKTFVWILAGFIVFRVFDIIKPWPISYLDKRIHGGLGIMIDDVLAGLFAAIALQAAYRILPILIT